MGNDLETCRKGKASRIYYKFKCDNCGNEVMRRKDEFLTCLKKHNDKKLCKKCSMLNFNGYLNGSGYVVRHYTSFPKQYWYILKKMSKYNGQITEHRAVMAINLNRIIEDNEIVHHINFNKQDNRIENLEILSSSEHTFIHLTSLIDENRRLTNENIKLREENLCLLKKLKQAKE